MKLLLLAALIFSPAASWAAGSGCQDTSGDIVLEKMRSGATGSQLFGCINRSFDTLSSSAALSGYGSTATFHLVFIDTIAGGSGGEGLYISTLTTIGANLDVEGLLYIGHDGSKSTHTISGGLTLHAGGTLQVGTTFYVGVSRVGVGTTSPGATLEVAGAGASIILDSNSGISLFLHDADTDAIYTFSRDGNAKWSIGNDESGSDDFHISEGGTLGNNTRLNINPGGNVGIGTTDPSSILYVLPGGNIVASPRAPGITISNTAAGGIAGLNIIAGTGSYSEINMGAIDTGAAYTRIVASVAGDLNFVTNNSTRVVILDGGNVGIGATTPGTLLQVGETGGTTGVIRLEASDGDEIDIGITTADDLYITGGQVGIGLTNPSVDLHVSGTAGVAIDIGAANTGLTITSTDDTSRITLTDDDTTGNINVNNAYVSIGGQTSLNAGNLNIKIADGSVGIGLTNPQGPLHVGANFLLVESGGDIGIGTTSPDARVEIESNSAPNAFVLLVSSQSGAGTSFLTIQGDGDVRINDSGTSANFQIDSSAGAGAFFVKGTGGNVGIGTTGPLYPLHVVPSVSDSYAFAVSSNNATTHFFRIDRTGHIDVAGADPTLANCANGTISTTAGPVAGKISFSGANGTCDVVFAEEMDSVPICVLTGFDTGNSNAVLVAEATTGFTFEPAPGTFGNGDAVNYICLDPHAE